MFTDFSKGYYFSSYWITQNNHNEVQMNLKEYNNIRHVYPEDTPIIIKIGNYHFKINGNENIPSKTIELSAQLTSQIKGINRIPKKHPIFLLKPNHIHNFISDI